MGRGALGGLLPRQEDERSPVILTPDQRLRVFISSTLEELAAEREAARRAVEALHLNPVWYESGARPHPPRSMYSAYLRQSHVFVGIYWERYGWVGPGMDVSGLEDEYRLAAGMPMLLYLKRPAPGQDPRLTRFLDGVRSAGAVSYRSFGSPHELERLLVDDLALLLSESFELATRSAAPAPASRPGGRSAAAGAAGNLPLRMTSFVGRTAAVACAEEALDRSRLVTITGVGGVGKSRLAVEVAASLSTRYPDGSWLCELAPASDAASMAGIVARALGVTVRQGLSTEESILEQLRDRRMLIILDNCEQVLDGAGRLAERLLQHCPHVRLLATSRQSLDVDGEQVLRLGPLATPGPTAPYERIAASDAVRLFVERAAAINHAFALDAGNAAAVAEICRRLDGMPLAIELGAARVDTMSPAEIAGLLDERFRLLTRGRRSAADRHQTLRSVIDWSYSLLTPQEQMCFSRLGVFAGTFDDDAVRAVTDLNADPWCVRDTMASLVAKSILVSEGRRTGPTRYRMFESLREYALERLVAQDDLACRQRRHAEYFADFAERAGPELLGPDELCWRMRLRAELGNLKAAVRWALDAGPEDGELTVRIAAALAPYALFEGAGDLSCMVERSVERARSSSTALRCAVLGAAAFAAFQNHGDIALAERLAAEALADGVPPDCPAPAHAYATMILLLSWAAQGDRARALGAEATALLDRIGAGDFHRAMIRQGTAASAALRGEDELARASAADALEISRRAGMPSGLAVALWATSLTIVRTSPGRAMQHVEEAVALMRAGASDAVLGHVLAIRAQLRSATGDLAGAVEDLRESLEVSHNKGDRAMLTVALDRGVTVLGFAGRDDVVATLAGACQEGPLAAISTLPQMEREDRDAIIGKARAELGDAAFEAAYARGTQLSVEGVTGYVLEVLRTAVV